MTLNNGTPTIRDLDVRKKGAAWATLATNVIPEYRVVSGVRRIENEQLEPLKRLGVTITPENLGEYKWDAYWDAPLMIPGTEAEAI